jgi:hypothetical protein
MKRKKMTIIKNIENRKGGNNTEVHIKYLYKMLFITLMKEGGVMAQTIIRNYNNKQQRGKQCTLIKHL